MTQAVARLEPQARRWPSLHALGLAALLAVTLGALGWAARGLSDPAALPIRKVKVEGTFTHLDPAVLQQAVAGAVDAGFFGVDVAAIRARLLAEPWIDDATIRRVWPDTLQVSVIEQVAVARWGEGMLLNVDGDIFAPAPESVPAGLVQLRGPLGSEIVVLARWRAVGARLARVGLEVTELSLSARHAWTLVLRGGTEVVLGRHDLLPRLERFVAAYERGLRDVWERVGRVDLRYTNGFAVSERRAAATAG